MEPINFDDGYIYQDDVVLPTLGDCVLRLFLGGSRLSYCSKVDEINKLYGVSLHKPHSNADAMVESDGHTIYVWIENNNGSLIVHEIIHIIDRIYNILGAECRYDELTAYLAEYLYRRISDSFNMRDGIVAERNRQVDINNCTVKQGV